MSVTVPALDVRSSSPLHDADRIWVESNCYVDLWIELLHALHLDPAAALAFTLSCDFEGDQWTFHKFPLEDLRLLYGLEVGELNIWLTLDRHIEEHLGFGRLLVAEVDAWFLPDTEGLSYRREHTKTSIVPVLLDRDNGRLGYIHGVGYHELDGEDYRGVLRLDLDDPAVLPPYVELVKLDRLIRLESSELARRARELAVVHLERRPRDNPIGRMSARLQHDLAWLAAADPETFHGYAFATLRQCGSAAELAGSFVDWLVVNTGATLPNAGDEFRKLAATARTVQFKLARVTMGKAVDVSALFSEMEQNWSAAMDELVDHYGA